MRNPTGSIARNPTGPAIQAAGVTEITPLPPLEAGPPSGPMARWVRVLEAFAESGEWGIRDLARATDIPRSAAHRILHDMAALGLLAPADEPGRFRVGADLARIGLLVAEHLDIRRVGRPFLERASAAIGETVVIAIYDAHRRQFSAVDAVETSHPIRYLWESLRDWSDLHLGSSGKGILAFLPPDEQEAILDRLPDPIPGRTTLSKARLREELEADRRRGYVVSHGERYEGAVGVSAPVRDARGRVVGDLIATWPDNRTGAAKEAAAGVVVRSAADDLSRRLGWAGPDGAAGTRTKARRA
jgi:IclR family acetate operon transcriptional repressor